MTGSDAMASQITPEQPDLTTKPSSNIKINSGKDILRRPDGFRGILSQKISPNEDEDTM